MKPLTFISSCLVGLSFCLAGCRHGPGATSFQFVDVNTPNPPTDARTLKLQVETSVLVDARPIEPLVPPTYPPTALAAHVGTVTIAVHITVGKNGRVTAVNPSMADVSIPTRFHDEFHQAIESALAQWHFEPAQQTQLEPGENGRPVVVGMTDVETSFDIAFTFSPPGTVSSKPH